MLLELSDKFVSKTENDTVNKLAQLLKDFDQRMTLDNLRLSQRYIEGELRLIMHIRLALEDYVTVFERIANTAWHPETANASYSPDNVIGNLKARRLKADKGDEQSMVLVGNVQFMDRPEQFIPTLVRLDSVDGIYGTLPHALYSSASLSLILRGQLPEREGRLLGRCITCNENKLIRKMIKRTSKVVDNVTDSQSDFNRHLLKIRYAMQGLTRLRILLNVDSIRFGFAVDEPVPNDFQVTEVLFGPFAFYPDKSKSFVSSHEDEQT